ncbi:outer membrane lipoprotein Blc [Hydra vulgaris]|uniref:outer membrane lipoprotein Blc n=1 Tax=Hydra vulgaris TaxID=6087 RepID=UPI00019251CA|nr:outer membrane lipoprotein Blc [Hydra vulgaris]
MNSLIVIIAVFLGHVYGTLRPPVITVDSLNLEKYAGRWYEMYNSPVQRLTFEKGLVCTTADYTMLSNDSLKVFYSGRMHTPKGPNVNITGTATVVNMSIPGALKVTYPDVTNISCSNTTCANYLVVKLGGEKFGDKKLYEYSIITSPHKTLVWILARDPKTFNSDLKTEITEFLKNNGYNHFWNKPKPVYHGEDCVYV